MSEKREMKEMSGVAFKNKKQSENSPDYYGYAMIDGKKLSVSIWMNKSQKGTNYFALKFREANENQGQSNQSEEGLPF